MRSRSIASALLFCALRAMPAAAQQPPVVKMIARDFVFEVPDTIDSGLVEFDMENVGSTFHEALLRRIAEGHTARELFQLVADSADMPNWLTPAGGPDVVREGAHSRVVQYVAPGNYVWLCFAAMPGRIAHVRRGMIRAMTVRASRAQRAKEPAATAVVDMADFSFTISGKIRRGGQWLRVNNIGTHAHEMTWFELLPGKTMEDLQYHRDNGGPRPFVQMCGMAPIASGQHGYVWVEPHAGQYAINCRITDKATGKTHSQLGMVAGVTIE